jgi:SAM-dependent methyltransferase
LFYSKNPEVDLLKWMLFLGLILLLILMYKRKNQSNAQTEGFSQSEPFLLKQNEAAYDDFYADVYDGLHDTEQRSNREIAQIIKMTEPTVSNSVFLDIGSGTGYLVNKLRNAGYLAYGVDKSEAMIKRATETYSDSEMVCADATDTMTFDKSTFTHILCTHFTIYQFQDKLTLFRNCYFWMKPNAYLILHFVEREKFDTILPRAKPTLLRSPQQFLDRRITDSIIEFDDFDYRTSYKFPQNTKDTTVTFQETFTDKVTSNVRQNEQILYMEDVADILALANRAGFIFHSKIEGINEDQHQYFYILERTL